MPLPIYPPRTELVLGSQQMENAAEAILENTNGVAEPEELSVGQITFVMRFVDDAEEGLSKVKSTLEELKKRKESE